MSKSYLTLQIWFDVEVGYSYNPQLLAQIYKHTSIVAPLLGMLPSRKWCDQSIHQCNVSVISL